MAKNENLMHIIDSAPVGFVFTNMWLEQQGISAKLAWWYVRSGLLERVGAKAYKKAGDRITWAGAVSALQHQMCLPVHVGGMTALQLLGRADFDPMTDVIRKVMIFADLETRMPSWLCSDERYVDFEVYRTSLFDNHDRSLGIIEHEIKEIQIQISCPERAAMEALYMAPKHQTLYDVSVLMEELGKLRPAIVQSLLESCNSIKVKRFFLYFAERFWRTLVKKFDFAKINLGSGKRVIGRGGKYRYHPKYMLSLPEKIDEPD